MSCNPEGFTVVQTRSCFLNSPCLLGESLHTSIQWTHRGFLSLPPASAPVCLELPWTPGELFSSAGLGCYSCSSVSASLKKKKSKKCLSVLNTYRFHSCHYALTIRHSSCLNGIPTVLGIICNLQMI